MTYLQRALLGVFFFSRVIGFGFSSENEIDSLKRQLILLDNDSDKIGVNMKLSELLSSKNFKEAVLYGSEALNIANRSEDKIQKALVNNFLGKLFLTKGSYDLSSEFFNEALQHAESLNNQKFLGRIYFNLGSIRLVLEDYNGALKYFEKSKKILEAYALENGTEMQTDEKLGFLINLGVSAYKQGLFEEAIKDFDEGLELTRDNNKYQIQRMQFLMAKGEAYHDFGYYEESFDAYKEGLEMATQLGILTFESSFLYGMSKAQLKLGDKKGALEIAKKSYAIAIASDFLSLKRHSTEALVEVYKAIGNSDSVLRYMQLSDAYIEELNVQEAEKKLLSEELTREFKQREKVLAEEMNKSKLNYLVVIFVVLLGASILFFFYILLRRNLRITELEQMKVENQFKQEELEKKALQLELELKDKELMTQTMWSIKQNELIGQVVDQVKGNSGIKSSILSTLNKNGYSEGQIWEEFEVRFQNVHNSFFKNLLERHPNLTSNERRLCAFLRLDMSTKEISALTGQSLRAIELGRIRLRKKLELTNTEVTLFDYISQF